jgi:hypothetical protein
MKILFCRRFPGRFLVVVAAAALAAAGCADKSAKMMTLHGTITYNDQPLRSGFLKIVGENWTTGAMIQPYGSFEVTSVLPGEAKVYVEETPQNAGPDSSKEPKNPPSPCLPSTATQTSPG